MTHNIQLLVPRDAIGASPGELLTFGGLTLFYMVADGAGAEEIAPIVNLVGPVVLMMTLFYGAWRNGRSHPAGIWTAIFWLRLTTAIYFGFGSIVPFIANDLTIGVMNHFHVASSAQMLKVNLTTALGVLAVLSTATLLARSMKPIEAIDGGTRSPHEMLFWGLLFGALGVIVTYVIALPYNFGRITWQVPGFLLQLSMMTAVGIYLVGSWAFVHSRIIFSAVAVLAFLDALVGLITFSKTDVLFPLVMIGLATIKRGATVWRVAPVVGLLTIAYTNAAPIVDYGRGALIARYNSITGADFEERLQIVEAYFMGGKETFLADPFRSEFQGSLARLSYMNQSSFAVELYDNGIYGNSLDAIAAVLIPRFLWPDKPSFNYLTADFTLRATGSATSLSWPGRYAEAYWNGGWSGILLMLGPLGVVYALLSRYSLWVFVAQRWAYFPVVLLGMRYGIDITGPFATSGVGALFYIFGLHFSAKFCEMTVGRLFPSKRPLLQVMAQPGQRRA